MTDVELTTLQYTALVREAQANTRPMRGISDLRSALEEAHRLRANHRYALAMTEELIECASCLLRFTALGGGAFLLAANRFDRDYILTPRKQDARARLLSARDAGAEIHEIRSYHPALYRPDAENDPTPWDVHDPFLRQSFRVPDQDVLPIWPDHQRP
ncbi:hypothetical protein [Streptomyces sp. NBC_01615]|uniref:hypothetical protein n=1 Tax=Streptomyces sp. NBC_01615 TaxID=2975898 RepID=UPI00386C3E97